MSWCWCLRLLGADCWNDLQVVVIRILVNWCAVIGWIGEPAVLCQYPPLHGSLLRAEELDVVVVDLVLGEQAVLGVWCGKFPVDWGQ